MDKLPNDFWETGPLCIIHGGTASRNSCKACSLALPPRIIITKVWVPFQVFDPSMQILTKRMDLPRFASMEEVKDFIQFNNQALSRWLLQWTEHDEPWALEEFSKGIGRLPKWKYGLPLSPNAEPINPDLYRQVKKLSEP